MLPKAFFSDDWFLDSLHKAFLNQTTLDLRKTIFPLLYCTYYFVPPDMQPDMVSVMGIAKKLLLGNESV